MAINLASASDGRVELGDLNAFALKSAFTFFGILKLTAGPSNDRRIFSQWGNAAGESALLCCIQDNDELAMLVYDGDFFGRKTTALNLANGNEYRFVITVAFGSPPTMNIYVNSASAQSVATFIASNNVEQSANASSSFSIGHEPDEAVDGVDAEYSEFAIWDRVLTSGEIGQLLTSNQPPSCIADTSNRLFYFPLTTTTDLTDAWSALTASLTGGSNATHPTMASCGGGGLLRRMVQEGLVAERGGMAA